MGLFSADSWNIFDELKFRVDCLFDSADLYKLKADFMIDDMRWRAEEFSDACHDLKTELHDDLSESFKELKQDLRKNLGLTDGDAPEASVPSIPSVSSFSSQAKTEACEAMEQHTKEELPTESIAAVEQFVDDFYRDTEREIAELRKLCEELQNC